MTYDTAIYLAMHYSPESAAREKQFSVKRLYLEALECIEQVMAWMIDYNLHDFDECLRVFEAGR